MKLICIAIGVAILLTGCLGEMNNKTEISKEVLSQANDKEVSEQQKKEDDNSVEAFVYSDIKNYLQQSTLAVDLVKREAAPKVKGIYVSAQRAGSEGYISELIALCKETELNAMVIDVKNEEGFITFDLEGFGQEAVKRYIFNIDSLISLLKDNEIYPIARIVCFKDNFTSNKEELYIKNKDGSIWRDGQKGEGFAWLNPYNKDSWEYILNISKAAAEVGFKEIQFDYIRFDTSKRLLEADFGETEGKTRTDIITEFAKYMKDNLEPYGVYVSADVYGAIITSKQDSETVGQDYVALSEVLDVICPMVYPSHYANNSFGVQYPDTKPYEIIYSSMMKSNEKQMETDVKKAIVRPWLQDFTASWIKPHLVYAGAERAEQIKAVYDAGLEEWILWDSQVRYDKSGLGK